MYLILLLWHASILQMLTDSYERSKEERNGMENHKGMTVSESVKKYVNHGNHEQTLKVYRLNDYTDYRLHQSHKSNIISYYIDIKLNNALYRNRFAPFDNHFWIEKKISDSQRHSNIGSKGNCWIQFFYISIECTLTHAKRCSFSKFAHDQFIQFHSSQSVVSTVFKLNHYFGNWIWMEPQSLTERLFDV